jgi:hypothetical protein
MVYIKISIGLIVWKNSDFLQNYNFKIFIFYYLYSISSQMFDIIYLLCFFNY